ncbi:ABC transporter ATP-binding protein [Catenuloplanes indicus]|uniref:ATP-binding cassette subfamily B protein n=1 Tax=Catenuloplanes indicus TaxID=137267 RepID=A0AAE3W4L7_9ACTN|nr:ABC transporter ATP-binding protein [Catenuloplanes indicus]MDQ0368624.1 ATP-binding cassette subfamily B protein [Catenuloplanes indicus]
MRVLLGYLRPHRRTLVIGLVLGLLASTASLATPLAAKQIIDSLGGGFPVAPVLTLLALVVVGTIISFRQWKLMATLAERVVFEARIAVVRRYFAARVDALTGRPTGELVTRATSDPQLLHDASASAVNLINSAVAAVATLALMAVLDLVLLGSTIVAVLIVGTVMVTLLPSIGRAQEAAQGSIGELGGTLEGSLRAIRTVKASRAEDRQSDRVVTAAENAFRHSLRAAHRAAEVMTVSWSGVQLAIIVVLAIGAWRVDAGLLQVSGLIAFLLYTFQLIGPLAEMTQNLTTLQAGIAAASRLRAIEQLPVEELSELPAASSPSAPVLELRQVSARYTEDGPDAVHEIDLVVPRHGHTAIVGPSGAGKTTLFSLILRFVEPTHGTLLLNGIPYANHQVRSQIAYVEQETPLVPGTIRDNLRFTHPDATDAELATALAAVRLTDRVAALPEGLDNPVSSTELSGGERQRIALARAIIRTPDLLLLDEATAQLDALTEQALQECIRDQSRTGAVITIAHRLSTVLDADHIIVLESGRIRAQGTHPELLASDTLYRTLIEALRITTPEPARA